MSAAADGLTPEQRLLVFVGAAEKRRLTLAEAEAMRVGIRHLAEQQRQFAATTEGLRNRVREWRQKAEAAQRETALATPYRQPCPTCGAQPGHRCRATRGIKPPPTPHAARLDAA